MSNDLDASVRDAMSSHLADGPQLDELVAWADQYEDRERSRRWRRPLIAAAAVVVIVGVGAQVVRNGDEAVGPAATAPYSVSSTGNSSVTADGRLSTTSVSEGSRGTSATRALSPQIDYCSSAIRNLPGVASIGATWTVSGVGSELRVTLVNHAFSVLTPGQEPRIVLFQKTGNPFVVTFHDTEVAQVWDPVSSGRSVSQTVQRSVSGWCHKYSPRIEDGDYQGVLTWVIKVGDQGSFRQYGTAVTVTVEADQVTTLREEIRPTSR